LLLSFLLVKYFYVRPGALEVLALCASVLLFLPIYFASFWGDRGRVLLLAALMCALGVLWARENPGASVFFIFASSMCARIEPSRLAVGLVLGVLTLGLACALLLLDANRPEFLIPTLLVGAAVGLSGIMDATVRRSNLRLLRKQEEVEHLAAIAERERISRDLHDLLGHTLSLITLKAELAGKLIGRDVLACKSEITDIENCARHALAEVRAAVTGYRKTGFNHELNGARASLAAANVDMSSSIAPLTLPPALETVLALALREAVTNIVRHAGATRCDVQLSERPGGIVLTIEDNGAKLPAGSAVSVGNGLTGMAERVRALGGELSVKVERGVVLELRLPLEASP
jgi:two-component system sensor histidine kinase DesK